MIELVLKDQSVYAEHSLTLGRRFYATHFVCTGEIEIPIPCGIFVLYHDVINTVKVKDPLSMP